jgi:hypothetical protein
MKCAVASDGRYFEWTSGTLGSLNDHYGRLYLAVSVAPGSDDRFISFRNAGNVDFSLRLDSTRHIHVYDFTGSSVGVFTNACPLGSYCRVEFHAHMGAPQTCEVKLFNTPSSSTPTETINPSVAYADGTVNDVIVGSFGDAVTATFYIDDVVVGAASYPGPIASGASTAQNPDTTSAFLLLTSGAY